MIKEGSTVLPSPDNTSLLLDHHLLFKSRNLGFRVERHISTLELWDTIIDFIKLVIHSKKTGRGNLSLKPKRRWLD